MAPKMPCSGLYRAVAFLWARVLKMAPPGGMTGFYLLCVAAHEAINRALGDGLPLLDDVLTHLIDTRRTPQRNIGGQERPNVFDRVKIRWTRWPPLQYVNVAHFFSQFITFITFFHNKKTKKGPIFLKKTKNAKIFYKTLWFATEKKPKNFNYLEN